MKFFISTLLLISSTSFAAEPLHYHYNADNGKCVDKDGAEGFNHPEPARMFPPGTGPGKNNGAISNIDVQCTDFSDFNFNLYIGFSYTKFASWNMSGAKFNDAKFHFADMVNCDLKGADLSKLDFGYTNISGDTDKYTKLPSGCENKDNKATCRR